jgi:hypothetical protein
MLDSSSPPGFAGRAVVDDDLEVFEVLMALFPGLRDRIDWCKNKGSAEPDIGFPLNLYFQVITFFLAAVTL